MSLNTAKDEKIDHLKEENEKLTKENEKLRKKIKKLKGSTSTGVMSDPVTHTDSADMSSGEAEIVALVGEPAKNTDRCIENEDGDASKLISAV